jgi:hypothetical protein
MREISGGSGSACQNSLIANFGLGSATNADLVRIEWPSGTTQELRNVAANQFLTVTEPPQLSSPVLTDGHFAFTLRGSRNLRYNIQLSTNAVDWATVGALTATNVNGVADFDALIDTAAPLRLYRATVP